MTRPIMVPLATEPATTQAQVQVKVLARAFEEARVLSRELLGSLTEVNLHCGGKPELRALVKSMQSHVATVMQVTAWHCDPLTLQGDTPGTIEGFDIFGRSTGDKHESVPGGTEGHARPEPGMAEEEYPIAGSALVR